VGETDISESMSGRLLGQLHKMRSPKPDKVSIATGVIRRGETSVMQLRNATTKVPTALNSKSIAELPARAG
jgi:hypothetical protein